MNIALDHQPRRRSLSARLARSQLGAAAVAAFVISAAAPMTVVAGSAATGFAVTGFIGVPLAYAAVGLILALFCVGYLALARQLPSAGGMYTFITRGLGKRFGVVAAAITFVSYNVFQISLYGAIGPAIATLAGAPAAGVPWWGWVLIAWAAVAVLGTTPVKLNGAVVGCLLAAEVAVVIVYDVVLVAHPAGGAVALDAIAPANLIDPQFGAILVGGIAAYLGFEATVAFIEEVRNPDRDITWATYVSLALIAILYSASSWAMTVATGPRNIVAAALTYRTDLYFHLAAAHLPAWVVDLGRCLLVTSLGAATLAFHNMINRYVYAMAREGIAPRALAVTGRRSGVPVNASLTQSCLALAAIAGYAAAGADPVRHMFFYLGVTGALGVLLLMALTSLAVASYFARGTRRYGVTLWQRLIAPSTAALVLGVIAVITVAQFGVLLDVPAASPLAWALPAGYLLPIGAGTVWAVYLRRRRPDIYATIGAGPAAGPHLP